MFKLKIARLNNIFGRSSEMCEIIGHVINQNTRLITVVGLPGIGKTTIIKCVALYLEERYRFSDGIIYITLSKIYQADRFVQKLY